MKEINVRNYNIGDRYARALGSTLKYVKPKALLLGGNKNKNGIEYIVKNLDKELLSLDLSTNLVSLRTVIDLWSWMSTNNLSNSLVLKDLNLSNNKMSDSSLLVLSRGLRSSRPDLKTLNLSKNMMGDLSAWVLGEYLGHAESLQVLDLGWNRISTLGGAKIFEGIREGRSCRNINMPFNLLGKSDSFEFVEAVQLAVNEENIKHLDFSFNRMSQAVWEKFGLLIMENHTLYGLHMEGNEWYIDKNGFIQAKEGYKTVDHAKHKIIYPQAINGFSTTIGFSKVNKEVFRPSTNCWVWEGWSEETFEFTLGKSFPDIDDPVHIHFEYNYFKPELMRSHNGGKVYKYTTMCPPGRIR